MSLEGWPVVNLQQFTHVVATETAECRSRYSVPNVKSLIKDITFRSATCAHVNPKEKGRFHRGPDLRIWAWETLGAGLYWYMDYWVLRTLGFENSLVFVCTFSGWEEVTPPEERLWEYLLRNFFRKSFLVWTALVLGPDMAWWSFRQKCLKNLSNVLNSN